jgi:hypothetical protein
MLLNSSRVAFGLLFIALIGCNKAVDKEPFVVELIIPAKDNIHCNYISVVDRDGLSAMIVANCGLWSVGDTIK